MTLIPDLERDLVEAAERGRGRRPTARAAKAAAVVAALAVVGGMLWTSDDPVVKRDVGPADRDRSNERPPEPAPPVPTPAPRPSATPVPGTESAPMTFEFGGVGYRATGYRSRNGSICLRAEYVPTEHAVVDGRPSLTCAGGRYLPRQLRRFDVLNVGGGGGAAHLHLAGFTRAEVSSLRVVGTRWRSRVALTGAWRPWRGEPIRAFLAVIDDGRRAGRVPPAVWRRLRVVRADGG